MIRNERQYRITSSQIEKFRKAIAAFDVNESAKRIGSVVLAKAELEAMKSEYENLSEQLRDYETLKSGTVETLKASTLDELPSILIRARIAKGLSQRELAEKLGLKEQQIQRYEAENYASANLRRLSEVAGALELNVTEVAEFKSSSITQISVDTTMAWDQFPIREMYRRNWFEGFSGSQDAAVANGEELVRAFVQEAFAEPIAAAARQRIRMESTPNHYALLAWQCRVLHLAKKKTGAGRYSRKRLTNEWLSELAHKSTRKDGPECARKYLQDSGILLVIEHHLSQTHLDGAAFLLPNGRPIIGMTLRYDRIDNFWFVLFHELVHVIKHLHKGQVESIFDNLDAKSNDIEEEADRLAGEILIPEDRWEAALARYVRSPEAVREFAKKLRIHPAIVAGRIRKEADNYTILTHLVGQGEVGKLFPEARSPNRGVSL